MIQSRSQLIFVPNFSVTRYDGNGSSKPDLSIFLINCKATKQLGT